MDLDITSIDESFEIEPLTLWQSQCFISQNPYHELLKKELISCIYQDAQRSHVDVKSNVAIGAKQNLQESDLLFLDNDDANIQALNSFLTELITTIATEVNTGFWPQDIYAEATIIESWYHITQNGGYHDAHSHPNCSWCGIYYLDPGEANLGEKNGVNRFYDPRVNADHYLDAGSQYLNSTGIWDIEPVAGQVIIFPSYLKHSALPYFGQSDRLVIAFNARVDFVE